MSTCNLNLKWVQIFTTLSLGMLLWTFDETLKRLELLSQAFFIHFFFFFFTYQHFYILYELRSATQGISFQGEQCAPLFPAEHLRPLAPLSLRQHHIWAWLFWNSRRGQESQERWDDDGCAFSIQTVQFFSAASKLKRRSGHFVPDPPVCSAVSSGIKGQSHQSLHWFLQSETH